jgi:hypothetical protein
MHERPTNARAIIYVLYYPHLRVLVAFCNHLQGAQYNVSSCSNHDKNDYKVMCVACKNPVLLVEKFTVGRLDCTLNIILYTLRMVAEGN